MKIVIVFMLVAAAAALPKYPKTLYGAYRAAQGYELKSEEIEDTYMTVPELLTKYGYPVEEHEVQTADGYLLTLYRIPYGKKCGQTETRRPAPVIVQHGILSSANDWIIMGTEHGLGYILADNCYDVWLPNSRGNTLSRKHISLDPDHDADDFWNFSWHEMGQYDLPAIIDYILANTGKPDLYYLGHSQGTTEFFVFATLHPEYAAKVRVMFALAPVAFMNHMSSMLLSMISQFSGSIEWVTNVLGMNEFLPSSEFLTEAGGVLCKDENEFTQQICANVLFVMCGFNPDQMNYTMLPVIMGHSPAGASTKQMLHYAQSIDHHGFEQYDYGYFDNNDVYGSNSPPKYDLEQIHIPIALHHSDNDYLAQPKDVDNLASQLPNLIGKFRVPDASFNHLDFMWAIDVYDLLYRDMIVMLNRY